MSFKKIFLIFIALLSFAHAQTINIGVLSYRPAGKTQKIWQQLGQNLHATLPQYDFNITAYSQKDLDFMIANGYVDFAAVHPSAFIEMEAKYGVDNIASIVKKDKHTGATITKFGGTIVTLSSRTDINTLQDVKKKKIASTHPEAFGAMLIQRETLFTAGVDILSDCEMIYTGQPMDNVLNALRKNKADVGFFRDGYIEEMVANGKINPDELKIINPQATHGYPYVHSTELYPEWAIVSTHRSSSKVVKAVTNALYGIKDENNEDYFTFDNPMSYKSVLEIMKKHQVYPFDKQELGIEELLHKYGMYAVIFLILLLTIAAITIYRYKIHSKMIEEQKVELESVLTTSVDGIHIMDLDGNLFLFSDSFAHMLGYTKEELAKLKFTSWETEIATDTLKLKWNEINQSPRRIETKHLRKDGSRIDVEVLIKGILINNKPYVYASSRDISGVKKTESDLIRYYTILYSLAEGVYSIDSRGRCNYINHSALSMLGLDKDDIIGKNPYDVFYYRNHNNTGNHGNQCPLCDAIASKNTTKFEDIFVNKDGSTFQTAVTVSPIIVSGIIFGSVIIFTDITKQKLYEQNLQELVKIETDKRLEQERLLVQQSKMAMMGEMIGAIAHQWRQPINSLNASVQNIGLAYSLGELDEKYMTEYKNETMHTLQSMSNTISDFKNFFSPNKKKEKFYIEDAILDVLRIMSAQLKVSSIAIEFDVDKNNKNLLTCYKNELKQVFLNILANAKDALLEKKPANMFIKIEIKKLDDNYEISIEDSAGGIKESIIDKIFDSHFTTKDEDKGTGIGLYMSKEIVEEHLGGSIIVENTTNGAKFTIKLAAL